MIRRCDLLPQYRAYQEEIDAALRNVLGSGVYTLGPELAAFENEFAAYNGVAHAVGVANGTDGLILTLQAFDIGPGDEVITTPFTAIPTVSAIIATGATPVFVDVRRDTFLLDVEKVAGAITPKTKAVMPVHLFGNVVNIPQLRELIGNSIPIIEDAAQAHGSRLNNRKAGSLGDAGVFSFYPTKNLGGYGDGGTIITENSDIAKKLRLARMYGMTDKDHIVVNGVNSRLDELQAAVLRVKLKHLDDMNEARKRIARTYHERLDSNRFSHQVIPEDAYSNYHVFVSRYHGDRDSLVAQLEKHDIQTNVYYPLPLHMQEANRYLGLEKGSFPTAEALCDEVIALPLYPELEDDEVSQVISAIKRIRGR